MSSPNLMSLAAALLATRAVRPPWGRDLRQVQHVLHFPNLGERARVRLALLLGASSERKISLSTFALSVSSLRSFGSGLRFATAAIFPRAKLFAPRPALPARRPMDRTVPAARLKDSLKSVIAAPPRRDGFRIPDRSALYTARETVLRSQGNQSMNGSSSAKPVTSRSRCT